MNLLPNFSLLYIYSIFVDIFDTLNSSINHNFIILKSTEIGVFRLNLNIERWEITCPQCNITLRVAGEKKYSKEIKNKVIDKWNSDEKWTERKKFDSREFLF